MDFHAADVFLTFDLDWAPAWATRALLERLERHDLEATVFVTHPCDSLAELRASGRVELGWHPNFLPGSSHGASVAEVLDTLAGWVPDAGGVRAHALMRGTPLLTAYAERGIRFEASDLHDGVVGLQPFRSWTGVWRLPTFFEDDVHLQRGLACRLDALALDGPGLRLFDFHPALVALNAADLRGYAGLKAALRDRGRALTDATPEDFAPFVEGRRAGVADLLDAVLAWLAGHRERAGGRLGGLVEALDALPRPDGAAALPKRDR